MSDRFVVRLLRDSIERLPDFAEEISPGVVHGLLMQLGSVVVDYENDLTTLRMKVDVLERDRKLLCQRLERANARIDDILEEGRDR